MRLQPQDRCLPRTPANFVVTKTNQMSLLLSPKRIRTNTHEHAIVKSQYCKHAISTSIFLQRSEQKMHTMEYLSSTSTVKRTAPAKIHTIEVHYFHYITSSLLHAMLHESATSLQFIMCVVFKCVADPMTHWLSPRLSNPPLLHSKTCWAMQEVQRKCWQTWQQPSTTRAKNAAITHVQMNDMQSTLFPESVCAPGIGPRTARKYACTNEEQQKT